MTAEHEGRRGLDRGTAHETQLRSISEADYIYPDAERQAEISDEINRYFNTPLDIFPFSETSRKPHRFYKFYEESIAERFPDDDDIRGRIFGYTRGFFRALVGYVVVKRLLLALALAGIWLLAAQGPALVRSTGMTATFEIPAVIIGMLLVFGVFAGINALIFLQYRIGLENRSYSLSRHIVQRTRELQNLYTTLRALPDQEETRFQSQGQEWGARAAFLIRLVMWVAKRMEYLEKFIQVEMWRVRRERYWTNWVGGAFALLITVAWAAVFALQPVTEMSGGSGGFRVVQGVGVLVGLALGWVSYNFWKTPVNLAKDKLGAESWIRYATLDLDDSIGDQVRRDKSRLVEYRTLNKGL
jgi:hypothetical protein